MKVHIGKKYIVLIACLAAVFAVYLVRYVGEENRFAEAERLGAIVDTICKPPDPYIGEDGYEHIPYRCFPIEEGKCACGVWDVFEGDPPTRDLAFASGYRATVIKPDMQACPEGAFPAQYTSGKQCVESVDRGHLLPTEIEGYTHTPGYYERIVITGRGQPNPIRKAGYHRYVRTIGRVPKGEMHGGGYWNHFFRDGSPDNNTRYLSDACEANGGTIEERTWPNGCRGQTGVTCTQLVETELVCVYGYGSEKGYPPQLLIDQDQSGLEEPMSCDEIPRILARFQDTNYEINDGQYTYSTCTPNGRGTCDCFLEFQTGRFAGQTFQALHAEDGTRYIHAYGEDIPAPFRNAPWGE